MPHSDIHGSTPARGSPWLFAACHVLHRLLVPRHPPNALLALEIVRAPIRSPQWRPRPPCTETTRYREVTPTPPSVPATAGHSALNTPLNATTRCRQAETCRSDTCTRSRPETHQTLIHPDKDRRSGPSPEPPTSSPSPFKGPEPNLLPATERKPIRSRPAQPNGPIWWRRLIWWR